MVKNLLRSLPFLFICSIFQHTAGAQCVTIVGLPDTINACKNTAVPLTASVGSLGTLRTLDTFWTPVTGLSNPDIINPVASIGTTSQSYKLTVTALTANNFVNNGNFDNGNTGFNTAYTLGTTGTWGPLSNEGTYGVSTNPTLMHTNFASFPDHTGNAGGQMLIVNGSATPNTNVWCQTISVVPNSQYDFSAWGASCVGSNTAVLQFAINGVLLGTPLALPLATGQWVQFHAIWNSGSNTSITICINDQQTAPSGNDFAIDDIEFRQICSASDSVYIRVANLVPSITRTIKPGCEADTVDFVAVNNGEQPDQYIWDFGDGIGSAAQNPTHIYAVQGQYTIKLITKLRGCSDSTSTTIDTRHPIQAALTKDRDSVCLGETITFDNNGDQTTTTPSYYYDFGDGTFGNTANPTHVYADTGVYTVTHVVYDAIPCSDTARTTVVIVQAPNASFTASESSICAGQTINFLAQATRDYDTLLWDYGDGAMLQDSLAVYHAYDTSGVFTVKLKIGYPQCPTINLTKNITVWPSPRVNLGPDTSICPNGTPIALFNRNASGNTTVWSTAETTASIFANRPGDYWLKETNAGGCSAADSITVHNACYLDIPTAFTPNNDGLNDNFFPRELLSSRLTRFKMQIYDRWGQMIFESTKLDGRGWDGTYNDKPQPKGVYIYLIEAQIEGRSLEKYQGNVSLIR